MLDSRASTLVLLRVAFPPNLICLHGHHPGVSLQGPHPEYTYLPTSVSLPVRFGYWSL